MLLTFQLSDDEDESYEKSILNKKIRRMNEKKRSKKIRRTDQDLCYYCRHAKQVSTAYFLTAIYVPFKEVTMFKSIWVWLFVSLCLLIFFLDSD